MCGDHFGRKKLVPLLVCHKESPSFVITGLVLLAQCRCFFMILIVQDNQSQPHTSYTQGLIVRQDNADIRITNCSNTYKLTTNKLLNNRIKNFSNVSLRIFLPLWRSCAELSILSIFMPIPLNICKQIRFMVFQGNNNITTQTVIQSDVIGMRQFKN